MRNVFWTIVCLGTGLVAFYFGFFHADAVCDDQAHPAWACHFKAAFTNEPLFLLVGAVFFLFGLWMLYRILRKPKITMPQPAPQVSPGQFQWDGTRWVPRPATAPPKSKRTLAVVGGIVVGTLILLGVIVGVGAASKPPDCTVGYSDSNLNIEVSGQGADAACRQFIPAGPGANTDGFPYAGLDPATGQPYGTGRVGQPSGDVICRVTLGTLSYTVRDSGLITLYGGVACANLRADQSAIYKAFPRVAFVMTGECPIGQPYCASGWDKLSPPFTANGVGYAACPVPGNCDWDMYWSYNCTGSDHYFYTSIRDGDGKTQATGDFTQPNNSDPHGSGVMHAHDNPDAGPRTVDAGASAGCAWTVMVIILGPRS